MSRFGWADSRVYDALAVARALGLENLEFFHHEALVYGAVHADSYRILATFDGQRTARVTFCVDGQQVEVEMPSGLLTGVHACMLIPHLMDVTNMLRDEMYSLTGVCDDAKFRLLVLSMAA